MEDDDIKRNNKQWERISELINGIASFCYLVTLS